MKKFALTTMSAVMLAGTLAACNTNDNAANDRYDNNTRPIGYYTDDNDNTRRGFMGNRPNDNNRGFFGTNNTTNRTNDGINRRQSPFMDGNDQVNNRNEGPITDMMDGDDQNRFGNNPQNNNRRGTFENRGNVGYYDGTDRKLAKKISERVKDIKGVKDARTIVYGDQIVIGVNSKDNNTRNVDRKVKASIRDIVQTQNVTVVTDNDMFDRISNVDDNMRNGNGINEVQSDINAIFNDLGNAISRPFQNNVR
ncbi:YhcN/YlaJ family sporulation lipoprotein [Pueribacillus sp. YX66]|uniref:YhcN/YlaJ family sporulation lipoprotein n=1 Tax=Pueribacillus sp. YX66 TaxID=3229242 RepID=UPI00358D66A3